MLIASFAYATHSILHHDQKDTARKIANYNWLISAGLIFDGIVALAIAISGLIAFSNFFSHTLHMLPISAKTIVIAAGVVLFILNITYAYYRIKKSSSELQTRVHQLKKEALRIHDEAEMILLEEGAKASDCVRYLEETIQKQENELTKFQDVIKTVQALCNNSEKNESSSELKVKLEDGLKIQKEYEAILQERRELLNYFRKKATNYILTAEEISSLNRHISKK